MHICSRCKQEVSLVEIESHIVGHFVEKVVVYAPKLTFSSISAALNSVIK